MRLLGERTSASTEAQSHGGHRVALQIGHGQQEAQACKLRSLAKRIDLEGFEPQKLGFADASALETQRHIQWARDPAYANI